MTDICYDTEFLDDGKTIELISIALVTPEAHYYAVNADCDFDRVRDDDWLWDNVVRHLPTTKTDWDAPEQGRYITQLDRTAAVVKPKWVIANEVRDFIQDFPDPRLWAYYGAYDHVALAQLWGPLREMPPGIPWWTHDLMQLSEQLPGIVKPAKPADAHDALADARWNMQFLEMVVPRGMVCRL